MDDIQTGEGNGVTDQISEEVPEVEGTPEEEGQKKALIAERKKRQRAEAAIEETNQRIQALEQMFQQGGDSDDEDLLTIGQFKQFYGEEQKKKSEKTRLGNIKSSVTKADKKYKDFEEVRDLANQMLSQEQMNVIALSDDPGEMLYSFGKMHPDYKALESTEIVRETIDSIQSNLNKPKTLSNAKGASSKPLDDLARMQAMSDEEIKEIGNKVLGR